MGIGDRSSGEGPGETSDRRYASSASAMEPDAAPEILFVLDMDGAITHVMPAIERMMGRGVDELLEKPFLDLLCPENADNVSQILGSCMSGESTGGVVTAKITCGEGEVLSLDMVVSPIRARGATIGLCLLASPTSGFAGMGRSYRKMHDEILDLVPAAMLAVDRDFNLNTFNRTAEDLTGYQRGEVIGKPVTVLLDRTVLSDEKIKETMDSAFERRIASYRVRLLTKKGERIEVAFRTKVFTDPGGEPCGILAISQETAGSKEVGEETFNLGMNLEMLAETLADIVGTPDPAEVIDQEMGRLIQSLSLDFAIFRMVGQDKSPLMFCSGIDFKKARELLESEVDGQPLYLFAETNSSLIAEDLLRRADIRLDVSNIGSLVCLPLRHQEDDLGHAFFGSQRPLESIASILPVLQVFCNQVAISFRNARLSRELARRNRMLQSLHETSRA
ncbi:MAG: PAS domain S-box protein, partial [Euryarchaeota archaeon]|nr:PAS domain S-box protein [Euryarchaeota archaeon]